MIPLRHPKRYPTRHPLALLALAFAHALLLFLVGKVAFMAYTQPDATYWQHLPMVWAHGFTLDVATACYLVVPLWGYMLVVTLWPVAYRRGVVLGVQGVLSAVAVLLLLADALLFPFWGFKLDATIFNYLDNPRLAMASVSVVYVVLAVVVWGVLMALCLWPLYGLMPRGLTAVNRWRYLGVHLLVGGLLFLGIRGGMGKSVTNVGQVYFSDDAYLNYAAINPAFNLMASAKEMRQLDRQLQFFPLDEAQRIYDETAYKGPLEGSIPTLQFVRHATRPNVIVILMEGYAASFVKSLGGVEGASVAFDSLAREGVLFTRCYANSFRTDRGTISALSGWPAYPHLSVMKQPELASRLPSIARSLRSAGYNTGLLYGGDINFTNAQAYFRSTGYDHITSDVDFSLQERTTHAWGVTDSIAFLRLQQLVATQASERQRTGKPYHLLFQTLASHDPWEVPFERFPKDPQRNAMAYLDHHLGKFTTWLKAHGHWDNTLLVLLPDHSIQYPVGITEADLRHSHIPLLFTGGAVTTSARLDTLCAQSDMVATLLAQLRLQHWDFVFSRNVLSKHYVAPYALHTWSGGFMYIDATGYTAYDLVAERPIVEYPTPSAQRIRRAKATLQVHYQPILSK